MCIHCIHMVDSSEIGSERLIRVARLSGNGAHVFVPREWADDEVVIVRKPKGGIRERVIKKLDSYLEDIIGIYLCGSYARGEEGEDSDIDLLVITSRRISIKERGFHIIAINEEDFDKVIKIEPLVIYAMLSEAKPIINRAYLEKLREKYKPRLADFKEFIDSSEGIAKINEAFIEEDKKDGQEYAEGSAYSILLRLRGIFILKQVLRGGKYTHAALKRWINSNCK